MPPTPIAPPITPSMDAFAPPDASSPRPTAPLAPATVTPPPLAALIAFDWADQKHDLHLWDAATGVIEKRVLLNKPEHVQPFIASLRERFGAAPVGILVEAHRGALMHQLMGHEHLHLFPINPKSAALFREALRPSGSKSDPLDAACILEMGRHHLDQFSRWTPDDEATRTLRALGEARRHHVDARTALLNQLRANLKGYYPQAIELCSDLGTSIAWKIIAKWPTLQALQKAGANALRKFYYANGSRRMDSIEARIKSVQSATALTHDAALLEIGQLQSATFIGQLQVLQKSIDSFDERLAQATAKHSDASIFRSIPGAGACLVPRLIAAFGSQRDRWANGEALASWAGVAPVIKQSGKTRSVHSRHQCPRFVRQTFIELAGCTLKCCPWVMEFYKHRQDKQWKHNRILRAIAFKWIRILWRMWKDRTPYAPAIMKSPYNPTPQSDPKAKTETQPHSPSKSTAKPTQEVPQKLVQEVGEVKPQSPSKSTAKPTQEVSQKLVQEVAGKTRNRKLQTVKKEIAKASPMQSAKATPGSE